MSRPQWRMTVYDLDAGAPCVVREGSQAFVYAAGGGRVRQAGADRTLPAGEGAFLTAGDLIVADDMAWVFEISRPDAAPRVEAGLSPVLSRVATPEAGARLLRADRVESQAGAVTPAHRHRGPGVRRLERGLLRAEVGDHLDLIRAGGAWFETGQETVVGHNISGGTNAFVRVMILPEELSGGKSSFIPATPADAARPRAATLSLFGEAPLL